MNGTILTQFTAEQLKTLFAEAIRETLPKPTEKRFTTSEASNYLGVSTVTLHTWKKKSKVKCFRMGNRLMFEQSELDRLIREVPRLKNHS